ncbi:MAG: Branched-chain amino acid aminotransferase [Actinomycetia bacterium]|nr:Branched-chain amino acid aminotransferase [Actinomycetes bacterium]
MKLLAVAVDGRGLVDPAEPVFRADDEALLRGSSAFETLPVYGGRPFELERHLQRLRGSLSTLGLPPLGEGAAESLVATLVAEVEGDFVLRLYRTEASLVGTAAPIPAGIEELRARGLRMHVVETGLPAALVAGAKATSYALALAALREAERNGRDDALFVADGIVLEAPMSNIWWRRGDILSTPTTGPGVLPGVTRAVAWELAREQGLEVREDRFPLTELEGADEVFTTSSVREVMPVVSLDDAVVGAGNPGAVAARLQEALRVRSQR